MLIEIDGALRDYIFRNLSGLSGMRSLRDEKMQSVIMMGTLEVASNIGFAIHRRNEVSGLDMFVSTNKLKDDWPELFMNADWPLDAHDMIRIELVGRRSRYFNKKQSFAFKPDSADWRAG